MAALPIESVEDRVDDPVDTGEIHVAQHRPEAPPDVQGDPLKQVVTMFQHRFRLLTLLDFGQSWPRGNTGGSQCTYHM